MNENRKERREEGREVTGRNVKEKREKSLRA